MENYEKINCYIRYVEHKVACVCKRTKKRQACAKEFGCEEEPLLRDKYYGWQQAFKNKDKD